MAEIQRILCPVDLSETSRHALDHAVAIAEWYDARVTVLHAYSAGPPAIPLAGMTEDISGFPPIDRREMLEEVRRFCALSERAASRTELVVAEAPPVKEIVERAERLPADLLVMGTHGRSGFEALFLGSITEKVLRSTEVPVLTVPPPVERVTSVVYKTILCPIEFSDPSIRALEYALTLAKETGARLVLLHVLEVFVQAPAFSEVGYFSLPETRRRFEDDARARLRGAIPEEARVWCTPEERVEQGKAYRVILDVAAQEQAELIVMGVHGMGALHRRLFGSTTHHVIREARCPVLTLRARHG